VVTSEHLRISGTGLFQGAREPAVASYGSMRWKHRQRRFPDAVVVRLDEPCVARAAEPHEVVMGEEVPRPPRRAIEPRGAPRE
jgi:hypothetical protein